MFRSLFFSSLFMLFTFILCFFSSFYINILIIALSISFFILSILIKKIKSLVTPSFIFLAIFISSSTFLLLNFTIIESKSDIINNENYTIVGTISDNPTMTSTGSYSYILKDAALFTEDGVSAIKPYFSNVRLYTKQKILASIYDTIMINANVKVNKSMYNLSKKVIVEANTNYTLPKVIGAKRADLSYFAAKAREFSSNILSYYMSEKYATFTKALLTGNKDRLSLEVKSDFKKIGVSHVLAVSGLHLSVVANVFSTLLLMLNLKRKKLYSFILIALLLAFMVFTGFTPSVTRATIMSVLMLIGTLLRRQTDSLTSLGMALFIMFIANPFCFLDIGLMLSSFSTIAIIVTLDLLKRFNKTPFVTYLYKFISRIKTYLEHQHLNKNSQNIIIKLYRIAKILVMSIIAIMLISVASMIVTMPVLMLTGDNFVSLIAPIANVLITIPASLCLILTLIIVLISIIPFTAFILEPLSLILSAITDILLKLAHFLASIPYLTYPISESAFILFYTISVILVLVFCLIKIISKIYAKFFVIIGAMSVMVLFILSVSLQMIFDNGKIKVHLLYNEDKIFININNANQSIILDENYPIKIYDIVFRVHKERDIYFVYSDEIVIIMSQNKIHLFDSDFDFAGKKVYLLNKNEIMITIDKMTNLITAY